jgi:hypothetical protein
MAETRPPTKIEMLVAEARAYLTELGVKTKGKTQAEIVTMARDERNKPGAVRVRWTRPDSVDEK